MGTSPSGLSRTIGCPGSMKLMNMPGCKPDVSSPAAARGTRLHEVCKQMYISGLGGKMGRPEDVTISDFFTQALISYKEAMRLKPAGEEVVGMCEERLDFSKWGWVIERAEGGRIDFAWIAGRVGVLIDYKFGKGYVERPRDNWQMLAYAAMLADQFDLDMVEIAIIQPASKQIVTTDQLSKIELTTAKETILQALKASEADGAELAKGSWCTYCRAKDICPQWGAAEVVKGFKIDEIDVRDLRDKELGDYAKKLLAIQETVKEKLKLAMDLIPKQTGDTGWKEKEASRKSVEWNDDSEAFEGDTLFTALAESTTQSWEDLALAAGAYSVMKAEAIACGCTEDEIRVRWFDKDFVKEAITTSKKWVPK